MHVTLPFEPDKVTVTSKMASSSSNIPKDNGIITIDATLYTNTSGGGDFAWCSWR